MRQYHKAHFVRILLVILGCAAVTMAQQPDRAVRLRPSEEPKREFDLSGVTLLDRTSVLPELGESAELGLAAVDRIHLSRVKLEGGSILESKEISEIVGPYEGRDISAEELFELRRKISEAYVRHGFVNSGVIIPDQKVIDGVVVLREIRGKLTRVDVSGNGYLHCGYIRKRIEAATSVPLRVESLQKALELLQQDPLIQQVNARLIPSVQLGRVNN